MPKRKIDEIRKLSVHDLAKLLEKVACSDGLNCPVCIGCKKAKELKVDCQKARELYLKQPVVDGQNGLLFFVEGE